MGNVIAWCGGRTWCAVGIGLLLGCGAFYLKGDSPNFGLFLGFLVTMCGVVAGRSISDDFKPKTS